MRKDETEKGWGGGKGKERGGERSEGKVRKDETEKGRGGGGGGRKGESNGERQKMVITVLLEGEREDRWTWRDKKDDGGH